MSNTVDLLQESQWQMLQENFEYAGRLRSWTRRFVALLCFGEKTPPWVRKACRGVARDWDRNELALYVERNHGSLRLAVLTNTQDPFPAVFLLAAWDSKTGEQKTVFESNSPAR